jgi:hypothetical protein
MVNYEEDEEDNFLFNEALAEAMDQQDDPVTLLLEEVRLSRPLSVIFCIRDRNNRMQSMANVVGTRDSLALSVLATFIHHSLNYPNELREDLATAVFHHFRKAGNALFQTHPTYVFDQDIYDTIVRRMPELTSVLDREIPCIFIVQGEDGRLRGYSRGNLPCFIFAEAVCSSENCASGEMIAGKCKVIAEERNMASVQRTTFYFRIRAAFQKSLNLE